MLHQYEQDEKTHTHTNNESHKHIVKKKNTTKEMTPKNIEKVQER